MAHQKTCQGTITLASFFLGDPTCNYDIQLSVSAQAITNVVTINAGMTAAAINTLINANRTGNTTGTLSASQVGNSLQFSISNIVLGSGDVESFTITVVNQNPGLCPEQNVQIGGFSCTAIADQKKRNRGAPFVAPVEFCVRRVNPNGCPPRINIYGHNYILISSDEYKCCYKR